VTVRKKPTKKSEKVEERLEILKCGSQLSANDAEIVGKHTGQVRETNKAENNETRLWSKMPI